ncbi:MAG: MBL fold metallo-hydrolase [Acidimicrobiales bacterium]|nr:MBL fold metallo-hydrolase [Acidimicrobiales bacterium]
MEPFTPTIDQINDNIYRIATFIPEVGPTGFTFNQFLVVDDEPLLFHTGARGMFPLVAEAVATVTPVDSIRWISFGHVESDECGSVNMWLAASPKSEVVFNPLGCDVSLNDMCDRPPRILAEDETLTTGAKRFRMIHTPHVPHGWEAQVLFEETTGTLFSGDVFSQLGAGPALATDSIVAAAMEAEAIFHASSLAPQTADTLRRLGDLNPSTLAVMHGSSFSGNAKQECYDLASAYEAFLVAT